VCPQSLFVCIKGARLIGDPNALGGKFFVRAKAVTPKRACSTPKERPNLGPNPLRTRGVSKRFQNNVKVLSARPESKYRWGFSPTGITVSCPCVREPHKFVETPLKSARVLPGFQLTCNPETRLNYKIPWVFRT